MYHHIFVAGTFDNLHKGHEALLITACTEAESVTVGITPDEFAKKYKTHPVRPFEDRKRSVMDWLQGQGWLSKTDIIPIADQFEPAASDPSLDALIVTKQNRATGEEINKKRIARGLSALTLIEVPIINAEDGEAISSTRVGTGEIDATGKLIMPEVLRAELQKPLGRLLPEVEMKKALQSLHGQIVVSVGDVVTKTFLNAGITPSLAIIDLKIGRKPDEGLAQFAATAKHIPSGPGFITREAIAAVGQWAETIDTSPRHHEVILIDGEEDLLVLPVLLASPLGSLVYYGQPGKGAVEVEVTIEKKKEMTEVLRKFEEGK